MNLNRKNTPALSELSVPDILPYDRRVLSNGIELISIHDPLQEIFKMDVIFEAGAYYQQRPLVASTAIQMLNEGTLQHSQQEIAETFDYYGAYIDFNCGLNKAEISLLSLAKYASETIAMLAEMIEESCFPEKEMEILLRNRRQQFLIEKEKTAWLAKKEFGRLLFGREHPYANHITEEDYKQVRIEEIYAFFRERINASKCSVILSGNIDGTVLQEVEKRFSAFQKPTASSPVVFHQFKPAPAGRYHISKEGSVQSSLRIGKTGVRLTDEDYTLFVLLNTVLGGYFGSRLMSNIREEKGYTYGINSFNVSMPVSSYWCIAADINNAYTEAAIDEVKKEIRKLQNEPIPADELRLVKNYLHGELLRELDGVFAQADTLKHKLNYGLDNQAYTSMIQEIKNCTDLELLELANKYMETDQLYIITAGSDPS